MSHIHENLFESLPKISGMQSKIKDKQFTIGTILSKTHFIILPTERKDEE